MVFWMPQFLSRQKELLCKQSRKLRGCKSYLRLKFVFLLIISSTEEYVAANLRIDGSQWENPRPLSLWAIRISVDYCSLIRSLGVFDSLIAYHLKDTYSNSTCIQSRRCWFESNQSLQNWDCSVIDKRNVSNVSWSFLSARQGVVTCYSNATRQDHSEIY